MKKAVLCVRHLASCAYFRDFTRFAAGRGAEEKRALCHARDPAPALAKSKCGTKSSALAVRFDRACAH